MRLICLFFLTFPMFAFADQVLEFKGHAKNEKGQVAYDETHKVVKTDEGKLISTETTYFKNGKKIAYLYNNYESHPYVAVHKFEDYRFNYSYGLKKENGKWLMFNQEKGEGVETKEFELESNSIASQGFNAYLSGKYDGVKKEEVFDFILPGKLTRVDFKVNKQKVGEKLRFVLEADSFFIRLLAPTMTIDYSKDRRIRYYKGPSNLSDDKQESQKVEITYQYPDEMSKVKTSSR